MEAESISLGNFPSTTASNFWVFLPKPGDVDCHFFETCRLPLRPQSWEVATIPIRNREGAYSTLKLLPTSPGMFPWTPFLLTRQWVLLTHVPPHSASAATYFVLGIKSFCGAATIGTTLGSILGFIFRATTGRVRLLNYFCSKSPFLVSVTFSLLLLVWVNFFRSCLGSPCLSLAVAVSNS